MNEPFLQELRHLLTTYVKSKRVVRLQYGSKQYLLRVLSVGQFLFHSEILDVKTRKSAGYGHFPVVSASDLMSLDEDNQWQVVQHMYESTGTRVIP